MVDGITLGKVAGETALSLAKNENIQNKVADLLGRMFPYFDLEKKALDMYLADIEKSNLSHESKLFAVLHAKETIKKIKNQKQIAEIAVSHAKEDTDFTEKSGVNREWFERFMDSAAFVSSKDIQIIWGKILAGEFEKPGSTPQNMTRILSEITSTYAEAFRKICGMNRWMIILNEQDHTFRRRNDVVVPFDEFKRKFIEMGLSFNTLSELETLGLIKFDPNGYVAAEITGKVVVWYPEGVTHEVSKHPEGEMPIGNVILTAAGECLRRIIEVKSTEGYAQLADEYTRKHGVEYHEKLEYRIVINDNEPSITKVNSQD